MVPYALSLNIGNTQANLLISIVGVSNMFGRGGLGALAQLKCVNAPILYVASYIVASVSVIGCGLFPSFYAIAVFSCIFGFFLGAGGPVYSELVFICTSLENFNQGLGLLAVFMAVGNLLGAPAAGKLIVYFTDL